MEKILITAATGNIGSQIVKILKEKNIDFVAGVTASDKLLDGVHSVVIDYNSRESLVKAFTGIDTLFLLYPMAEKMTGWNTNAIDAAKIAGVKHILRSSGAGADENATFLMPKVQGTIDKYIIESGIDYTITRPAAFMQNFVNFMTYDIKKGTVYQPVKADVTFNWVDVRDIATVNAEILMNPSEFKNQILFISGNEDFSYAEGVEVISKAINKPVSFVTVTGGRVLVDVKAQKLASVRWFQG